MAHIVNPTKDLDHLQEGFDEGFLLLVSHLKLDADSFFVDPCNFPCYFYVPLGFR